MGDERVGDTTMGNNEDDDGGDFADGQTGTHWG
jgi:hypothetical protein